jgi:hypothetical protein
MSRSEWRYPYGAYSTTTTRLITVSQQLKALQRTFETVKASLKPKKSFSFSKRSETKAHAFKPVSIPQVAERDSQTSKTQER